MNGLINVVIYKYPGVTLITVEGKRDIQIYILLTLEVTDDKKKSFKSEKEQINPNE